MKRLLIVLLVLFFASPVSAFPGRDNDDATDWPTDCEKYPYLHVCQQPEDPRTDTEICHDGYIRDRDQAELRITNAKDVSIADGKLTIISWNSLEVARLTILIATLESHIKDGGEVEDTETCSLKKIEKEEAGEEEPADSGGGTGDVRDANGCKIEDDGQIDCE